MKKVEYLLQQELLYQQQVCQLLVEISKSSDSTAPKAYGYVYSADPETLDYLISGKQSTKVATSNGIDGLFTNDKYGNLTPAVAEDWSVSKDGLTYTYKIRKGEMRVYQRVWIHYLLWEI